MNLRTHHVVILFVVAIVLGGNCLLTSADRGTEEGAIPWSPTSLLHPLVEVLNLRYALPTPHGVEIKSFVFGTGTAVLMCVAAIGWFWTDRDSSPAIANTPDDASIAAPPSPRASAKPVTGGIAGPNMSSLTGGQIMFALLVAYSLFSANWSFAPDFALGGTAVLTTGVFWALALGRGLNRDAAKLASRILVAVCALTAALAVWYFYERNPHFRAKYPVGNPLFLAAVLLPGILLSMCGLAERLHASIRIGSARPLRTAPTYLVALVVLMCALALTGTQPPENAGWATALRTLVLSGSRAAAVGLCAGLFGIAFFALRKRGRITLIIAGGILALASAAILVPQWESVERFGRGATVRLRLYAWSYAWQMTEHRNLTGVGQGGYTLLADGPEYAGRDILADPQAFRGRLAHAHNEWIETWADLGSLGLALLVLGHVLTLIAGATSLSLQEDPVRRWILVGLLASLVALSAEEFFNVALRVPGLPALYFTVVGLIWSMCGAGEPPELARHRQLRPATRKCGVALVSVLALCLFALYRRDFAGARTQIESTSALQQDRFDSAIEAAEFAAHSRLEPARQLEARTQLLGTYAAVARAHIERARRRNAGIQDGRLDPHRVGRLVKEDYLRAETPLRKGLQLAEDMRRYSPGNAPLGSLEADLCALLAERAEQEGRSGAVSELRMRAVEAIKIELQRSRFDENLALRYLNLAGGIPISEQLRVLCGPIRGSSAGSATYAMAAQLARKPAFLFSLNALLKRAQVDLRSGDPLRWSNLFSPEICRIAAALEVRARRFDVAIERTKQAIQLYSQGRNQELLGLCRARTLLDLGWFAFLNDLRHPDKAREWTKQAIQTVPPTGDAERFRNPMYAQLISISLAAQDEDAAREWARKADPELDQSKLDAVIGRYYAIVSELFLAQDIKAAELFLESAEAIAPDDLRVRWASARLAFLSGHDRRVVDELTWLLEMDDPQRTAAFLQAALSERPESETLRAFYERMRDADRLPELTFTTTRPTTPAENPPRHTQPAPEGN